MDPYGLDPTPEEQQAALLAALRARLGGQQAPAAPTQPMTPAQQGPMDVARAFGNLGMLSGDSVLSKFGANQVDQAQQADALQEQAKQRTLSQILEANRAAQAEKHQNAQEDIARRQLDMGNWDQVHVPETGETFLVNKKTKEKVLLAQGAPRGPGGKTVDDEKTKALADLGKDLDPNQGRAGEFGKNQARVNRADRILNVANVTPDGNYDKRQMEEIAIGAASILSDSGSPAQASVHALVPESLQGNAEKLKEWLTGEPQGLEQQKFARKLLDTVKNEKETITGQMRQAVLGRLPKHVVTFQKYPDEANNLLRASGFLSPDELDPKTLLLKQAPGGGSTGGLAGPADGSLLPPDKARRLEELRKKRDSGQLTAGTDQ